ncbi:MAG: ribonuclease P protein component [Deltaproteobacteria bacterium]|nr:ribonuclease P protein component [Deltaproteobacteria bacterium]
MTRDPLPSSVGDPQGESLPRRHRIRRRSEIKRVQDGGARFVSGALVLMVLPNPAGLRRLGVTVSSKVGNSVVRSKVKRWFREIFRHQRSLLPPSCDVVLVARAAAAESSLKALSGDFEAAAKKARRRFSSPEGSRSAEVPDGEGA